MKRIQYYEYGDPQVMKLEIVDQPKPDAEEVLVKVHAAGINELDWKIRNGNLKIQDGSGFPKMMGCELSGDVVAVGETVDTFKVGDNVFGWLPFDRLGAFAEYAVVESDKLHLKPEGLSYEQAAALPMVGATALQALTKEITLTKDTQVLINGATGGVGHFAVQIAHIKGAQVSAVASGDHLNFAKRLGADTVIDYHKTDVREQPQRYDVILDTSNTLPWPDAKKLLKEGGTYLDLQPGLKAFIGSFIQNVFDDKTHDVLGVEVGQADLAELAKLADTHQLKVTVDKVFELSEFQNALTSLEEGTESTLGKAVLRVSN